MEDEPDMTGEHPSEAAHGPAPEVRPELGPELSKQWDGSRLVVAFVILVVIVTVAMITVRAGAGA